MKKIAICIGNNNYLSNNQLNYSEMDASSMAETLNNLGFDTTIRCNLSKNEMVETISDFFDSAVNSDTIVFYYAGHGCEMDHENVLVPIDVDFNQGENVIRQKSYEMKELLRTLGHFVDAKKIIILDACRTISVGTRSFGAKGFSPISSPKNTLIAFSTSPGKPALEDSSSGHGLYTGVLLEKISTPRIHVESMFKQVRIEMIHKCESKDSTSEPQISWEHSSLVEDFFFNPASIYQGPEYTQEAYFDHRFSQYASTETGIIIEKLRSHDFNQQNIACVLLRQLQFDQIACLNDLFVIGRNITQSAEGVQYYSHECSKFICNFMHESIPREAKKHILNGMAYEMYFDHDNTVRKGLKNKHLFFILNYLESDQFLDSQQFIASKLTRLEDFIFYIPGSKSVTSFHIRIEEMDGNLFIKTIKHINRLVYNVQDLGEDNFWIWGEKIPFMNLNKYLAQSIGAQESGVSLVIEGVDNKDRLQTSDIFIHFPIVLNHYIQS